MPAPQSWQELSEPGGWWAHLSPSLSLSFPSRGAERGFPDKTLRTALLGNLCLSQQISRLIVFSFPFSLSLSLGAFSPPAEYPTSSI